MIHLIPFPLENFSGYCQGLNRVGVDLGFIMYSNHHDSNHQPVTRYVPSAQFQAAQDYINNPSDEGFRNLVAHGILMDTEWDRKTNHWCLISFQGWETLHNAFARLYSKSGHTLQDLTGIDGGEVAEIE